MKTRNRHISRCCACLAAAMVLLLPACTDPQGPTPRPSDREIGLSVLTAAPTKAPLSQLPLDAVLFLSASLSGAADSCLEEDLGRSLVPLTVHIETDDNSLTSEDIHLLAESGDSLFDSDKRNFHYVKTIIYTDYYNLSTKRYTTSFDVAFKRNMTLASGGATTTVRLADADGWFISHDITLP